MAAKLDSLYHAPGFLEMDHMTLLAELIGDEYREKLSKTLTNRLRTAKLVGSPEELDKCIDSAEHEYMPTGKQEKVEELYEEILTAAKAPRKDGKGYEYPVIGHMVGLEGKVTGDRTKLLVMAGF